MLSHKLMLIAAVATSAPFVIAAMCMMAESERRRGQKWTATGLYVGAVLFGQIVVMELLLRPPRLLAPQAVGLDHGSLIGLGAGFAILCAASVFVWSESKRERA